MPAISFNTGAHATTKLRSHVIDEVNAVSDKTLGYLYLTVAMVLVGSTVVASKIAAAGLPPFTATALRFALALPCFLVLLRVSGQRCRGRAGATAPSSSCRGWPARPGTRRC
jgi:hypothetical protein